jgi:pSer/pThr/pTyr-binding forkhead associated (FHA) protein
MTTTDESIACRACGSALAFGSPFCGACGSPVQSSSRWAHDAPAPPAALVAAGRVDVAGPGWSPISGGPLAGRVPARPGRRVGAYLIDGVCASLVVGMANAVFVSQLNSALMSGSSSAFAGATRAAMFGPLAVWIVGALAMLMVEGATGVTIGNAAMRIRTVSVTTGGPPGLGRALGRRFIEQLGSLVLIGAPIIAASSAWDDAQLRQGWQDKIAGTTMVGVGPRAGTTTTSRQQLELTPPSVVAPVVPADARPMSTLLPPVAPPSTGANPAPEAVAEPGQAPSLPRTAGGLIATVPGFEAVAEPALPFTAPPSAAVVVDELDEDLDHTRMSPTAARHAGSYQLRFDTGEVVMVDGSGLVGRSPTPRVGERVEHLVPIVDPARSVSKTHLAFGIGPDGFWVSDRDSTNGTRAVSETGVVTEVLGDVRVTVTVGGTVEFGERQFTVVTS